MEEMVYKNKDDRQWLEHNTYKNYEYVVMSLGTHPTAYIGIPKGHRLYGLDIQDIDIDCHGGCTYSQNRILKDDGSSYSNDKWWIGWDYAHLYDYLGWFDGNPDFVDDYRKHWTTKEIVWEVEAVIDSIGD